MPIAPTTLSTKQRLSPAVFAFALSLVVTYIQVFNGTHPLDHVFSDMRGYLERGWRLAAGAPFIPFDAFYPPLTSYVFALLFLSLGFSLGVQAIVWMQLLLVASSAFLTVCIAARLYQRRALCWLTAIIVSLYLPFSMQASYFMSEALFSTLLLVSTLLGLEMFRSQVSTQRALTTGAVLGFLVLCKGQGLCLVAALGIGLLVRRRFIRLGVLVLGFVSILSAQAMVNSAILGRRTVSPALNGAFNMFLAQSRREAIGCYDHFGGWFFIFHNNNAGLQYHYFTPTMLPVSILRDDYFTGETVSLWKSDPLRQLVFSLQNAVELLEINPRWPYTLTPHDSSADTRFQSIFFWVATLPALASIVAASRDTRYRPQIAFLCLPLLFVIGLAALTSGQPRYLLPFQYGVILLALPWYSLFIRSDAT